MIKNTEPKEFRKLVNKEFDHLSSTSETIVFTQFIDHFRELNAGSLSQVTFVQPITDMNDVINQPFSLDEI